MLEYKWSSPHEWLEDVVKQWTRESLEGAFLELALKTDSDTLQDIFQEDMDEDGYFHKMKNEEN